MANPEVERAGSDLDLETEDEMTPQREEVFEKQPKFDPEFIVKMVEYDRWRTLKDNPCRKIKRCCKRAKFLFTWSLRHHPFLFLTRPSDGIPWISSIGFLYYTLMVVSPFTKKSIVGRPLREMYPYEYWDSIMKCIAASLYLLLIFSLCFRLKYWIPFPWLIGIVPHIGDMIRRTIYETESFRRHELIVRILVTCYFLFIVLIHTWRKYEDYKFVFKFHQEEVVIKEGFDYEKHFEFISREMNSSYTQLHYATVDFEYQHVDLPASNVP